ncbi:ABC transporter permease [Leekyejoonella antrihumi]|uniref:ABC transporter permease n=1 Tax=Leekyejoonella antrihumi TaxID=1660198 RepID=A0A563DVC1_9MICO|nr:ABC transporter permease [Leekyejoonella antrihumi]TWP34208.1 ABC transporter permease [Leekyejoonella antrihumi]
MFLALRDLRFAKGRFALMGAVIVLISLLVVMLTGLTAGLGAQSTSAITSLPGDRVAMSQPPAGQSLSYTSSHLSDGAVAAAKRQHGVKAAAELQIAQAGVQVGGHDVAATLFGADPASFVAPHGLTANSVVISDELAKNQHLSAGDEVGINGMKFTVAAIRGDSSFSHMPVVWVPGADWGRLVGNGADSSVLVLSTGSGFNSGAFDHAVGVDSMATGDSLSAIGSYSAEHGSLTMMQAMLMGISALVIGAFFTVWTIGRTPDLAVLKAMGARTWYLVRDALGEALILLVAGGALGTALAATIGTLVGDSVPFVVDLSTTAVPLILLVLIGMVGAAAAIRRISTVDPITALGAAR